MTAERDSASRTCVYCLHCEGATGIETSGPKQRRFGYKRSEEAPATTSMFTFCSSSNNETGTTLKLSQERSFCTSPCPPPLLRRPSLFTERPTGLVDLNDHEWNFGLVTPCQGLFNQSCYAYNPLSSTLLLSPFVRNLTVCSSFEATNVTRQLQNMYYTECWQH
ncbi:twisted bristles roughened eye [Carabus blaptoides fortunei]